MDDEDYNYFTVTMPRVYYNGQWGFSFRRCQNGAIKQMQKCKESNSELAMHVTEFVVAKYASKTMGSVAEIGETAPVCRICFP